MSLSPFDHVVSFLHLVMREMSKWGCLSRHSLVGARVLQENDRRLYELYDAHPSR